MLPKFDFLWYYYDDVHKMKRMPKGSTHMKMQESPEDYLETIYMLSLSQQDVRSIDVARHLGYSKPSVSVAMKRLRENGYVLMDESNLLSLTEEGLSIARRVYERHNVITKFLVSIGIDQDTAQKDACRVEHVISETTFQRLKELANSEPSAPARGRTVNHRGTRL